ncbi:hypothetical protein PM082_000303 [Marasmius tenuissimus]|nr:hypothetical protein PM082_000303 [Marasmius tenuissimus]
MATMLCEFRSVSMSLRLRSRWKYESAPLLSRRRRCSKRLAERIQEFESRSGSGRNVG